MSSTDYRQNSGGEWEAGTGSLQGTREGMQQTTVEQLPFPDSSIPTSSPNFFNGVPQAPQQQYPVTPGINTPLPPPVSLVGDLNSDCGVGLDDLSILLFNMGHPGPLGDENGDLLVNLEDLSILLFNYGRTC